MLDEDQTKTLFNKIYKLSPARSTEIILNSQDTALIRFANNQVIQNVSEDNITVSIRVLHDNRMGRAITNKLDDATLSQCCEKALHLAKIAAPDPDALPLPGAQTYKEINGFYESTRLASAFQMSTQVEEMISVGSETSANMAGINQVGTFGYGIGNSQGLFAYTRATSATASVTAFINDCTGFAIANEQDIRQIEYEALARTAIEKAKLGHNPQELPPGEYTVILEPQAVANLLSFLILDYVSQICPFSGTAVIKNQGFVAAKLGDKMFGDNFTLEDNAYHPLQQGIPFDGEGMPKLPVLLISNGILSGLIHSRASALQMGEEPTGHGLELPNSYGALPEHLIMHGGESSVSEMVAKTDRGILITRFWYNRLVDPNLLSVTGMTRDGTFLIENGQITGSVKNLRFNESLFRVFRQISDLGKPVRTLEEESGQIMVVPPIRVEGFRFTNSTLF